MCTGMFCVNYYYYQFILSFMKAAKTTTTGRNTGRLQSIQRYSPWSETDILDTDEDKVMKHYNHRTDEIVDMLDSDEDTIMQYYKGGIANNQLYKSKERIHS